MQTIPIAGLESCGQSEPRNLWVTASGSCLNEGNKASLWPPSALCTEMIWGNPPLGAIVHNCSESLGFGPVELIPNRPHHSSVLGSACRGNPANKACAGISPHTFIPIPAHTLLRTVYIWNQLCCRLSSTRDWSISFPFKGSSKLMWPAGHQLCLKGSLTAEHLNKDAPKLLLTTRPRKPTVEA